MFAFNLVIFNCLFKTRPPCKQNLFQWKRLEGEKDSKSFLGKRGTAGLSTNHWKNHCYQFNRKKTRKWQIMIRILDSMERRIHTPQVPQTTKQQRVHHANHSLCMLPQTFVSNDKWQMHKITNATHVGVKRMLIELCTLEISSLGRSWHLAVCHYKTIFLRSAKG